MKRKIIPIFIFLAGINCYAQNFQQNLTGKWLIELNFGSIIEFTESKMIEYDFLSESTESYNYIIDNNELITSSGFSMNIEFEDEDTLLFTSGVDEFYGYRIKEFISTLRGTYNLTRGYTFTESFEFIDNKYVKVEWANNEDKIIYTGEYLIYDSYLIIKNNIRLRVLNIVGENIITEYPPYSHSMYVYVKK
jgi:hypothetical protein